MFSNDFKFRKDFQKLARLRIKESRQLLRTSNYQGAYYLAGLAIECAFKACIAKNMQKHMFPPNKTFADKCWQHNFDKLIGAANLDSELKAECVGNSAFDVNWKIVSKWNVEKRYDHLISETDARGICSAITAKPHGVMQWLQRHW